MSCIFCDIVAGSVPATFLHRDDRCSVFMDIRPVNAGHMLIIPNEHAPAILDVDPETAARMMQLALRFTRALRDSRVHCEGVNLFLADGEAAGQEVFHTHLHLFPRFRFDGFGLRFAPGYSEKSRAQLEATARLIAEADRG